MNYKTNNLSFDQLPKAVGELLTKDVCRICQCHFEAGG